MKLIIALILKTLIIGWWGDGAIAQQTLLNNKVYRGISCLQCMADFRQAKQICLTQYLARLKKNVIPVILDGSFGPINHHTLQYCMVILTKDSRQLILQLYLHSGPGQRVCTNYQQWKNPNWWKSYCRNKFNNYISNNIVFKDTYLLFLQNTLYPILNFAEVVGAKIRVGWLEDNFTEQSYFEILNLTRAVLGDRVEYLRNPVNETGSVFGKFEVHQIDKKITLWNGIVFNDGDQAVFPWQTRKNTISLSKLAQIFNDAERRNNDTIYWNGDFQGSGSPDPLRRHYRKLTAREQIEIIKFLRRERPYHKISLKGK